MVLDRERKKINVGAGTGTSERLQNSNYYIEAVQVFIFFYRRGLKIAP